MARKGLSDKEILELLYDSDFGAGSEDNKDKINDKIQSGTREGDDLIEIDVPLQRPQYEQPLDTEIYDVEDDDEAISASGACIITTADDTPEDNAALYKQEWPDFKKQISDIARKKCNRNFVLNFLPIVRWLPKYEKQFIYQDFVAGITVGLTAIPQGIAYAQVAGLPPSYGLYSGFMGCFVYLVLGSCKDVTIGPTAIMALMIQKYVSENPENAVLAAFLQGCIILLLGLLNLGFVVQFISSPVSAGFVTAAAITIGSGQIRSIFGIPGKSNEFIESWDNLFHNFGETKLWDTLLGITTLICLILLKKVNDIKVSNKWKPYMKFLSLSRNALAVIIGIVIAYSVSDNKEVPFNIIGEIQSGLPSFKPPPVPGSFTEIYDRLGSSLIALPFISILESIAVAKAFSKGKIVDATQEMVALGVCNIMGSFVSSIPITGSFTRTALNHSSGVQTPFGGVYTGILVLLALGLLTSTFYYIPKASLAAVIIAAMIYMIEYETAIEIWKTKRIDIIPFVATLLACLGLGLEYGMLVGIAVNLLFVVYQTARPRSTIEIRKLGESEILIITPDQSLVYSSAEYMRNTILKHAIRNPQCSVVILNGVHMNSIDTTGTLNIKNTIEDLKILEKRMYFWQFKVQVAGIIIRSENNFYDLFINSFEDIIVQ